MFIYDTPKLKLLFYTSSCAYLTVQIREAIKVGVKVNGDRINRLRFAYDAGAVAILINR